MTSHNKSPRWRWALGTVLAVLALIGLGSLYAIERPPSLGLRLSEVYVGWSKKMTVADLHAKYQGVKLPDAPAPTGALSSLTDITVETVQGRLVYTLTPKTGASTWHILYTHGGGYVNTLKKPHWDIIESLIKATGATVTVPIYPLAPEHQYEETYQLLTTVYSGLLTKTPADKIILAGDSAGGGLALGQALHYRDLGLPQPGKIVLFSPWVDATLCDPQVLEAEKLDVMLGIDWLREAGRWWAGDHDPKTPLVSPLYGDLRGLAPIQVYIGTHDLFLPDSRRLNERVLAAGGKIEQHETLGGFHVFMGATFTPEAKEVYRQIAESLANP